MLAFEDFFRKKKIDLVTLKQSEPSLYAEFELHYAQMGEKSFDHSKKYWFNKLRRIYHTSDEPKAEKPAALQIKPEDNPGNEKPAYTPRFKAKPVTTDAEPPETIQPAQPGVYKPRFKPQIAKPQQTQPEETPEEQTPKPEQAKPAYKPRFNPRQTKPGYGN